MSVLFYLTRNSFATFRNVSLNSVSCDIFSCKIPTAVSIYSENGFCNLRVVKNHYEEKGRIVSGYNFNVKGKIYFKTTPWVTLLNSLDYSYFISL
jgi:hypothetical protein